MLFKELKILLSKKWWLRFLSSESLVDGLRNTLSVVIPVWLLWFVLEPISVMAVGLGALLMSLTDAPSNRNQKINNACRGLLVFGLSTLGASFFWDKPIYCALLFFLMPFAWSMLGAFSNRAWLTGSSGIILACFIIGFKPVHPLYFSFWVMMGTAWYLLISLIQAWLVPFRSLKFAMRECLYATADFLRLKEACYDPEIPMQQAYQMSMTGHLKVSEQQEAVRELLLSDRLVIKKDGTKGKEMLALALEVMALYEHVSAMSIDYEVLRNSLDKRVLSLLKKQISLLADWVESLAKSTTKSSLSKQLLSRIENIEEELNHNFNWADKDTNTIQTHFLTQMGQHIHTIVQQLKNLTTTLKNMQVNRTITAKDYVLFWNQPFTFSKLTAAFHFQSPVFRFSFRMAIILSAAYMLSVFVFKGNFGYWLLLTIVVVARPRFGITWKRNAERLLGTAIGALTGLCLLLWVTDVLTICILATLFLWGYFSFLRIHYTVSVFFITMAVLISLGILNGLTWSLWLDRLWFTVWGCLFAIVSLFIFPFWEHWSLKSLLQTAKKNNANYLQACLGFLKNEINQQQVALARKASHTALARLSEGLSWSWLEPVKNKLSLADVEQGQVLLYRINANITALWVDSKSKTEIDLQVLETISHQFQETLATSSLNEKIENLAPYEGLGLLWQLSKSLKKSTQAI